MTRDKDKKPGKEQQLLEAARLGQVDQLELLLNQFHKLKTKKRSNPLASLRKCIGPNTIRDPVTGFTCLHHAALNGHSRAVQLIVSYGGRLNAVDYKGSTALHLAAWSGNLQVVKTLMSYLGAPQATTTTTGERENYQSSTLFASSEAAATSTSTSPLAGSRTAPTEQAKQQIKSSSPNHSKHTASQQQAASPDAGDCVPQQQKLQIDHRNNDNQTALSLAAQFGHSQVVAELLAHRADPNLRNNQLESPLDLACLNGHLNTVRVLLDSSPHLVEDLSKPHSILSISTYPFSHVQPESQEDNPAQVKRQPSASGWSSLLRGTTMKDLSPTSDRAHKTHRRATMASGGQQAPGKGSTTTSHQSSLDSTVAPVVSERLLDHSPLHHAVRRAHLDMVDLLLNYYEANIYQLTSLGSVMHELVMANHSFRDATKSSVVKHYPHGDMVRVFLARLSRMSSGNSNDTRTRWQHLLSARNGQQRSIFDMLNDINDRNAQELQRTILDISERLGHNLNRPGQQRPQQPVNSIGQRQQVFTDSNHLNSFVTMKRVPKHGPSILTRTRDDEARLGVQQRQPHALVFDGTQTIGRSKVSAKNWDRSADAVAHLNHQVGSTRSISSMAQNSDHQMTCMANTERPSTINWPALTNMQQNQQYAQQHQLVLKQNPQAVRSKRSKSRDLGSIMKEVNQNGSSSSDQEQLYDNQLLPSMSQQLSSNHLVRSQTDCSHVLGRFFGQHEYQQQQQQQPTLPNGGRPSASGEHRLQAADLARHHYKQQNQHAHSSENSSLISGLDQERLVPTSIAQQHSATLDRRAINRHYHVYEHEFYPPRLVTATHQGSGNKSAASHHASDRAKQAVAIVPPLNHRPDRSIDGALRFPRSTGAQAISNSRLSLNMENISFPKGQQLPDAGFNQQEQMNRFVARSSRQSTGGHPSRAFEPDQQSKAMVDTCQSGHGYEQQPTLMPRPQSMHSSQSLESRLGSDSQQALSFENTRRALMRDFDKMLGRELLNTNGGSKYSDHSSDGGQSGRSQRMVNSTSSSSQNSILTGVSLDMDTRGEHLIVSGTRITMPEMPPAATMMNQSISSGSMRSSPPSNEASQRVSPRESNGQTTQMSSQRTQTGTDKTSPVDQNRRDPPPQKPPRPSLESQQIYKALRMGGRTMSDLKQQARPVIYDVPSHNNSLSNLADCAPVVARRPGSRTSINSSSTQMTMTPPSVGGAPPARPPQPMPRKSGVVNDFAGEQDQPQPQQVSITQPPTERPPPPPVPSAPAALSSPLVTGPLESITATSKRGRLTGPVAPSLKLSLSSSSSCNSPGSSTSSSFKRPDLAEPKARNVAHITNRTTDGMDSGVCTSNSPASTSHDSERGRAHLELSFESRVRSKPDGSVIMGPPSPRTAQMSIEEAFMPLEETTTQEVANQTNSIECSFSSDDDDIDEEDDADGESASVFELAGEIEQATSLGSQVDEIFGWLGSTNKSPEDQRLDVPASAPRKAGYENCIELQDRLRASRCRSIGDLFRGISSELNELHNSSELDGRSTATSSSSVKLAPARTCSSEEGDYAATSETRGGEHPESSSSGDNSSTSLETQPTAESDQHNSESAMMTPGRQCKEIMVRVVVDESQKETNGGDDVFYISPLELKRISANVDTTSESTNTVDTAAGRFSEAETLTEEELCASVDKNTGYIRFTLRKRRATSATVDDSHLDLSPSSLKQHLMLEKNDLPEPLEMANAKRTKINSYEKEGEGTNEQRPEQLPEPLQTDQCESNETMQQVIEHEERKEQVGARKASGDSISMDTSHASSSSSSSTSEMSIKSIVSLKVQRPELNAIDNVQAPDVLGPVHDKQIDAVDVNLKDETDSREHTPTPQNVVRPSQSGQVDDKATQVNRTVVVPKVATSLVSETARRLEAAAAAKAASGPLPAAAARRNLKRHSPTGEKVNSKPAPALLPKKSICWPPKKVTDDNDNKIVAPKRVNAEADAETAVIKTTTSTPTGPVIGRVSANRLSFQRLIEEKSKAANNTLGRLKPPPPAKPAGLIVPQSFKS